jgi:hypothetical protein
MIPIEATRRRKALGRFGWVLLFGAPLLLCAAGCRAGKAPEKSPLIEPGSLVVPVNQVVLRLYVIGWRQEQTADARAPGFRIEGDRVVPSPTIETAAGHSFTPDELDAWASALAASGLASMYADPSFIAAPGNDSGLRDARERQYLATWRFMPNMTLPRYEALSPGTEIRLRPELFDADDRILVHADIRMTAARTEDFLFAYAFSKVSPGIKVELPRSETMNVSGSVLVENGGAAVLAHYVKRHRPAPDMPMVRDHVFYVVSAEQPNPGPREKPADPDVPRMFPGQEGTTTRESVPPRTAVLTLRWDRWTPAGSEKNSSETMAAGARDVSEGDLAGLFGPALEADDGISETVSLALAEGYKAQIEIGANRSWVAGLTGGQEGSSAFQEISVEHGTEGVRLGLALTKPEEAGQVSLAGFIGGPMDIEMAGEVRPALRPDAAPEDVEKYFFQTCSQQVADLGLALSIDGAPTWRITPAWRLSGTNAPSPEKEHLLLVRAVEGNDSR